MSNSSQVRVIPWVLVLVIGTVLLFGVAPDMTWMGLGADSPGYVASTIRLVPGDRSGYPTYILIGHLFQYLPSNPYWNLGLLSALSTLGTSVLIYRLVRQYTDDLGLALAGMVLYPASFIVWTQSVIPEVYTFTAFLMLLGAYLVLQSSKEVGMGVWGLAVMAHPLALLGASVFLWTHRGSWPLAGFLIGLAPGVLFLAVAPPLEDGGELGFLTGALGLVGGLSLVPPGPTVQRFWEAGTILLLGPGLLVLYLLTVGGLKGDWRSSTGPAGILLVVGLLVCGLYFISFPPQWVVYLVPGLAFLIPGILIMVGRTFEGVRIIPSLPGVGLGLLLLGWNLYAYDIGFSIDPQPTTARQFYQELRSLPGNSVVYDHTWGYTEVLAQSYIQLEDTNLVSLSGTYGPVVRTHRMREGYLAGSRGGPIAYGQEGRDAENLQESNPSREIYISYLEDTGPIRFGLVPISLYSSDLNNLPERGSTNVRD